MRNTTVFAFALLSAAYNPEADIVSVIDIVCVINIDIDEFTI